MGFLADVTMCCPSTFKNGIKALAGIEKTIIAVNKKKNNFDF
jgi:hypothetical protein